jgi:hypothetical protein
MVVKERMDGYVGGLNERVGFIAGGFRGVGYGLTGVGPS